MVAAVMWTGGGIVAGVWRLGMSEDGELVLKEVCLESSDVLFAFTYGTDERASVCDTNT